MKPAIVVHGGAWNLPDCLIDRSKDGIQRAVNAGNEVLQKGGTSVDAVCAAICVLEDDYVFDAGHGSFQTESGGVEMDAFIMDGSTLNTGAVCTVDSIPNPILLARDVMEKTSHCLLAASGALEFAKKLGYPIIENKDELPCKEDIFNESKCNSFSRTVNTNFNKLLLSTKSEEPQSKTSLSAKSLDRGDSHDTVGAVAIDVHGHIACGTSTGGIFMKMKGRVADTALIGCGGYANEFGGASATGHGEAIIRTLVCREVVYHLEAGLSVQAAAEKSVKKTYDKTGGRCGVIAIDKNGKIGLSFTTSRMVWAYISDGILHYGID